MGVTVINPASDVFPLPVETPIIEIKRAWADDWMIAPELQLVRAVASTGSQGVGECTVQRPFGRTKQPWDADLSTRQTWDLTGWWLRIRLFGASGFTTAWIGQVTGEPRDVHGSDQVASGIQKWHVVAPFRSLEKIHVHKSFWIDGGSEKTIGWVPSVNRRDQRGVLVGNRSASLSGTTYVYGGTDTWTRRQYIEYILARFTDQSADGGVAWSLTGQLEPLDVAEDVVRLGGAMTVRQILDELIPRRFGLDYALGLVGDDGEDGFSIHVFALTSEPVAFAGAELPTNPNQIRMKVASKNPPVVDTRIERYQDHQYAKLRVVGQRIVVVTTLRYLLNDLENAWSSSREAGYKRGAGDLGEKTAEDHDLARTKDRYRAVYQHFRVPSDWDHLGASPKFDLAGEIIAQKDDEPYSAVAADYQNSVRRMLTWLPLREGFDYTEMPPVDNNPTGHEPDFIPPICWIKNPEANYEVKPPLAEGYVPSESLGIALSVSQTDFAIRLHAVPNHLLAKNHFDDAADTGQEPLYNYQSIVATVAIESDQRIEIGHDLDDNSGDTSDGSTMVIEVPDAACWYLAEDTVVDVEEEEDGGNKLVKSPGGVLRNDIQKLAFAMAGAIARYHGDRIRATIRIRGLVPWQFLLGQILTAVEDHNETVDMQAPITSVEWVKSEDPVTIIRTGFATR